MSDLMSNMININARVAQAAPAKLATDKNSEKTDKKEQSNTTRYLLLGAAAAAAIAVAGIYIARSRKMPRAHLNKAPQTPHAPKPEPQPKPIVPEKPTIEQIEQIKQSEYLKQTIEEFKQTGKFENGRAILNNGENFDGQLTNQCKDGSKFVLEYKNGLVRSVKRFNGEEQVFEKAFTYNKNGNLREINKNGKKTAEFLYDENGKKFLFHRTEDNMHYFFKPDGKTLDYYNQGKSGFNYTDKNGVEHQYTLRHNELTEDMFTYPDGSEGLTLISGQRRFDTSWQEQNPILAKRYKGGHSFEKIMEDMKLADWAFSGSISYRAGNFSQNYDHTWTIARVHGFDKNMKRFKYYRIASSSENLKIRNIIYEDKNIVKLVTKEGKLLGKYNLKTKKFSELNDVTAEELRTELDKINAAGQKVKEKVTELYTLQRKDTFYSTKLKILENHEINKIN